MLNNKQSVTGKLTPASHKYCFPWTSKFVRLRITTERNFCLLKSVFKLWYTTIIVLPTYYHEDAEPGASFHSFSFLIVYINLHLFALWGIRYAEKEGGKNVPITSKSTQHFKYCLSHKKCWCTHFQAGVTFLQCILMKYGCVIGFLSMLLVLLGNIVPMFLIFILLF